MYVLFQIFIALAFFSLLLPCFYWAYIIYEKQRKEISYEKNKWIKKSWFIFIPLAFLFTLLALLFLIL